MIYVFKNFLYILNKLNIYIFFVFIPIWSRRLFECQGIHQTNFFCIFNCSESADFKIYENKMMGQKCTLKMKIRKNNNLIFFIYNSECSEYSDLCMIVFFVDKLIMFLDINIKWNKRFLPLEDWIYSILFFIRYEQYNRSRIVLFGLKT